MSCDPMFTGNRWFAHEHGHLHREINMQHVNYVAYYRVSTARQGRSGLGLDAQREAVSAFLQASGGNLAHEFTEIETGKLANRPQLNMAMAAAKKIKGRLIIAKLDRLARNAAFVLNLMESGIDFVAADMPYANKLTVQIMAAFAEFERDQISKRTRDALAAAKARGATLGANGGKLAKQHEKAAEERAMGLRTIISAVKEEGHSTVRAVCEQLNHRGIPSPAGGRWHLSSTHRLLARLS